MSDRLAELEAFIRIVEHKTLSAAARALNCSPSAMSKLIQRLENRLGVRLINRTSRAFSLTPEGELFYREGQRALDAVTQAEQAVAQRSEEVSGLLRIGTSIQIAQFYLAPLIPRFRELHPRLELQFVLKAAAFSLVEHQIDVAVFSGEQANSSYVARRIAAVRWIVCASPAYLQRAGTPTHPKDLARHDCLNFLPGADLAWPFLVDAEPFVVSPAGSVRASSGELLRVFAILGMGIARVPIAQVHDELQTGVLVPLLQEFEDPTPEWLYAVYQSARHLNPRAQAFLRYLDGSFRQPPAA
ncbi:MAG: LysR family transcriptional regulator [Burkholderiaceae bacterium]|nr:LysR family transcriptional regulator [Burkholderiaceae bacterium]